MISERHEANGITAIRDVLNAQITTGVFLDADSYNADVLARVKERTNATNYTINQ